MILQVRSGSYPLEYLILGQLDCIICILPQPQLNNDKLAEVSQSRVKY